MKSIKNGSCTTCPRKMFLLLYANLLSDPLEESYKGLPGSLQCRQTRSLENRLFKICAVMVYFFGRDSKFERLHAVWGDKRKKTNLIFASIYLFRRRKYTGCNLQWFCLVGIYQHLTQLFWMVSGF